MKTKRYQKHALPRVTKFINKHYASRDNVDWTIFAASTEWNQDGDPVNLVDHSPAPMDLTDSRDSQTVSEKLCEILLSKDFCGFEQITSSEDPDQIAEDIHRNTRESYLH